LVDSFDGVTPTVLGILDVILEFAQVIPNLFQFFVLLLQVDGVLIVLFQDVSPIFTFESGIQFSDFEDRKIATPFQLSLEVVGVLPSSYLM